MTDDRLERAKEVNAAVKRQRHAIDETIPQMMTDGMIFANGDYAKARSFVGTLGVSAEFLTKREWAVGMTTAPGELVYDRESRFVYAYSGKTTMQHANPTFYPGASGVYYWSIIPEIKDDVKIYPNIQGIVVAVKKDEIWWNQAQTQKFYWRGADNANCSWPPMSGNEWGEVIG